MDCFDLQTNKALMDPLISVRATKGIIGMNRKYFVPSILKTRLKHDMTFWVLLW